MDRNDDILRAHALVPRHCADRFARRDCLVRVGIGDTGRSDCGEELVIGAIGIRGHSHADHGGKVCQRQEESHNLHSYPQCVEPYPFNLSGPLPSIDVADALLDERLAGRHWLRGDGLLPA
jgi:hypothetical protein